MCPSNGLRFPVPPLACLVAFGRAAAGLWAAALGVPALARWSVRCFGGLLVPSGFVEEALAGMSSFPDCFLPYFFNGKQISAFFSPPRSVISVIFMI